MDLHYHNIIRHYSPVILSEGSCARLLAVLHSTADHCCSRTRSSPCRQIIVVRPSISATVRTESTKLVCLRITKRSRLVRYRSLATQPQTVMLKSSQARWEQAPQLQFLKIQALLQMVDW